MSSNLIVNNIEVGAGATIYTAASNQLAFGTNGAERVRIDSSGDVAIGRENVLASARLSLQCVAGDPGISIQTNTSGGTVDLIKAYSSAGPNVASICVNPDATPDLLFKVYDGSNTVEKLRIAANGRVGILTVTPEARLDVYDTSGLGIISRSASTQATDSNKALKVRNNSTTDTFSVSYKGKGYFAGRVGIGTEAGSDLHLLGDAPVMKITPTNWQSGFRVDVLGMGNNAGNGQLFRIQKDGSTKFQINEDADVIVYGDNNAELKLQCGTSDGNNIISFINSSGSTQGNIFYDSDHNFMVFKTNGTASANERLRITSAGIVEISNFNGTGLRLKGSGGDYQGVQLQTTDSSASQTRNIFIDVVNETGAAIANQVGSVQSDGGSAWIWQTQPAGNRSDRRVERLRIKSDGNIVATGNIQSNNLPGNNLIHNGEFAIWQRGTTAIYSSQNKYLTDRFKFVSNSEGNGSVHQHTNVPTVAQTGGSKFAYSLRLNCTTADTSLANNQYINLSTRIEGQDLRHLGFGQAGTRYATLSFWQRSASGTYHVSFRNSAYNRYYIASYTAANNTWEKHELTIPIDTAGTWESGNGIGVDITWSLGGGSWYNQGTVGSWSNSSSHAGSSQKNFFDTVGNDFYITGVQFEKGTIATPFEHKSYGEDLRQCQRYFFPITAPVGFINATEDLGTAFTSSANEVQFPIKFPVHMRSTPSVEQVTGSNYFIIGFGNLGGDKYLSGSWAVNNMSPNCGNLYTDPDSNLSSYIGQAAGIQSKNTSARLALRSEL